MNINALNLRTAPDIRADVITVLRGGMGVNYKAWETKLNDDGLSGLSGLSNLENLDINSTGVTNKSAAILGGFSKFGSCCHGSAQHIPGRNLRDPITLADEFRLRPLTGTRRAEEDQFHRLRAPRSLVFLISPSY